MLKMSRESEAWWWGFTFVLLSEEGGLEHIFKEREGSGAKSQPDSAGEAVLGRAPARPPSGTDGGTRGQLVSEGLLEGH